MRVCHLPIFITALAGALLMAAPSLAQQPPPVMPGANYVVLADLTLNAPVIVKAGITRTRRIKPKDAPGLAPGRARLLLEMQVEAALVARSAVPAKLEWLWDVPLDARGKLPSLKGQSVLAFLQQPAADGQARLMAGPAMQAWNPALESRVRAIATEAAAGTVPKITGVSNGFRVQGTIAGEAESQFFLTTADARPLTMVVLDRPGQRRQISVASTDIIDESAIKVQPETLLWYSLACFLPASLPARAGGADPALAAAWSSAIDSLGKCTR